jgi:hypothetical protein
MIMDVKSCPHCGILIVIDAVNCGVFRCGVYRDTGDQVNPHLSKEECDDLKDTIWGCGKPFRLRDGKLVPCDYV